MEYAATLKAEAWLRLSIRGDREGPTFDDEEYVAIICSHIRSNFGTGGRVHSRPMTVMHVCYAHLLFADGIREVLAS